MMISFRYELSYSRYKGRLLRHVGYYYYVRGVPQSSSTLRSLCIARTVGTLT